jgi:DNA-binding transcriptional LysR family regulator
MQRLDLELLVALDTLLAEGSVTAAAARMNRSVSAMSRTLMRIRHTVGDPIFVRAGRRLVPTTRAEQLGPSVRKLVEDGRKLLAPDRISLSALRRTFTVRANDAFISAFASKLATAVRTEAPGVTLCFAPEGEEDVAALREGRIDLDIGTIQKTGPEVKSQSLFRERFVGVMRSGHDLATGKITPKRYAAHSHVVASRRGKARGPIDEALASLGLSRTIALLVPSHTAALLVAGRSDLVAAIPVSLFDCAMASGLKIFELPFETQSMAVVQSWHPRLDADEAHRWLRSKVREICRLDLAQSPRS